MLGAESTTEEVLEGTDLSGVTAVVTGASAGLGVETVRALAGHGATIIATARDLDKAGRALTAAGVDTSTGRVTLEELDLADLASIRNCTDRINAGWDRLNLLVANAGVMACPPGRTVDGFETQFGVNHLGHFVFVNRLVPLLEAGAPSRIVCLSSSGHRGSDVDLDDPNFETTTYTPFGAYARSKTANVLFAVELDRRLGDRGVRACAVHPGAIDTELDRHLDEDALAMVRAHRVTPKSIEAGAATTVWAAAVADPALIGGHYAEDCAVAELNDEQSGSAGSRHGVRAYAVDPTRARALWTTSEQMVGEQFG
jgi:NAD(P)-dependent dehydrogenase (short-subunit alcohol dehydrogenase family)